MEGLLWLTGDRSSLRKAGAGTKAETMKEWCLRPCFLDLFSSLTPPRSPPLSGLTLVHQLAMNKMPQRRRKGFKSQRRWMTPGNRVFRTQQDCCSRELPESENTCKTRSGSNQTKSQNPEREVNKKSHLTKLMPDGNGCQAS